MLDWNMDECLDFIKHEQSVYEEKLHEYTVTFRICKDHPNMIPVYRNKLYALKQDMDILSNMFLGVTHYAVREFGERGYNLHFD